MATSRKGGMKFLADENFPMPSVTVLRKAGHDIQHIGDIAGGSDDEDVVMRGTATAGPFSRSMATSAPWQ